MANWADDIVNIGPNGFSSVKIKADGDAGYYALPHFRNASFRITGVGSPDNKQRMRYRHFVATFSCELMDTDVTNQIELIPILCAGASGKKLYLKIDGLDGQTKFYSQDITSVGGGHVGCLPRISANADGRVIGLTMSRRLTAADYAEACVGPATADGSQDPGDALYPLRAANVTHADIRPSIIRRVQWCATGGTITDNSLTNIRDASLEMAGAGEEDSYGRAYATRFETTFECVGMQAHQDELTDLATHVTRENDIKIDFGDDYATFTNLLGLTLEPFNEGDFTGQAGIQFRAAGNVLASAIAGIWVDSAPA